MLLDGLCHNLERDCETSSTDQPCNQHHLKTEVDHLKLSDDRSVLTQEDQRSILFLAKECNEVEYMTRFILSDKTSSANQLERDDQLLKSSFGEGITGENHDGFQSPTKVMDTISSAGLKCPLAPIKPKATPLTKRKREHGNMQDEFVNEVELVLSLLSSELEDKKLKRARLLAAGEIINDEAMN